MNASDIDTAMILAAGFGKRLRPITDKRPKPLVEVGGRKMLDRALDRVAESGISRAVVNVHYLGDQIVEHCAGRENPACVISDERDEILETGGGIVKALPILGPNPFLLLNADTFWVSSGKPVIKAMIEAFDPSAMDMLLLTCRIEHTTGHTGGVDFSYQAGGRLERAATPDGDGVIYAGAAILSPAIFDGGDLRPHSLNIYFDEAINAGRLYGHDLQDGHWITVGTPESLALAEEKLRLLAIDAPSSP